MITYQIIDSSGTYKIVQFIKEDSNARKREYSHGRVGPKHGQHGVILNHVSTFNYNAVSYLNNVDAQAEAAERAGATVHGGHYILPTMGTADVIDQVTYDANGNKLTVQLGLRTERSFITNLRDYSDVRGYGNPQQAEDTLRIVSDLSATFEIPKDYRFLQAGLSRASMQSPNGLPILQLLVETRDGKNLLFRTQITEKNGQMRFAKIRNSKPQEVSRSVFAGLVPMSMSMPVPSPSLGLCVDLFL